MYRLTILYGTPADPDHFRTYYYQTHIPLARRMKGLTGWNLCWPVDDGSGPLTYVLVAELYAESRSAMTAILESPEGVAAREDLDHFVTGTVEFLGGEQEEVALS